MTISVKGGHFWKPITPLRGQFCTPVHIRRYVFDGRVEIDNNAVERCIRGIALTKKNSLFAGNHDSAEVWATYYSLIETARLNGINPRSYLNWVVEQIEVNRGDVDYEELLPWHCPEGHIEA